MSATEMPASDHVGTTEWSACSAPPTVPSRRTTCRTTPPAGAPGSARLWAGVVRWRTPLVVIPLLSGLVVAGGLGARMMTSEKPTAVDATTTTCWDGAQVAASDDCTSPSGKAGLRWVFPSLRPNRPQCTDDRADDGVNPRPVQWTCTVQVVGTTARITYFQLADLKAGLRYHARLYRDGERKPVVDKAGETVRQVWRREVGGRFELTTAYVDHPYAVSIVAPKRVARERALRTVTLRAADAISVRPAATTP